MRFWKTPAAFFLHHAHGTIATLVTAVGLLLFAYSGIGASRKAAFVFLQDIEQRSLDLRFALRGTRRPDPNIVIVGIDEKTLQKIGSYPLPRSAYATLITALKQQGARVIAFDMTFPLPESSETLETLRQLAKELDTRKEREQVRVLISQADIDARFASALNNAGNVVLGHLFLDADRAKYADPEQTEKYFDVIWAKAFPQVVKVKSGKQNFEVADAWINAGGAGAEGIEANLPQFAEQAASYGFFNISPDDDGTLRRALFMIHYRFRGEDYFFPSLDLEVVQQYESIPDQQTAAFVSSEGLQSIQFGSHAIRPREDGKALINYAGPYHTYPHYSMIDVLRGETAANIFRDKIVLVGATALGIGDLRNTPFQQQGDGYMGVEVHANIIDNLLHTDEPHRSFLVRGFHEELADIGLIVLLGAGLCMWFARCRPMAATVSMVFALAMYIVFVYLAFVYWGRWYSLVVPSATLLLAYFSSTSFRVVYEEREKRQIRKTFSQYLSPAVISVIEKNPERYFRPGGEIQELTIMFSDIRDFTTISESMGPDDLVRMLNEYFTAMTDVLLGHYGTLDKYIGDAIMAFWGSPYPLRKHAHHACATALAMVEKLAELNRDWGPRGFPEIAIGIGLNSGPVNVGNIGSEKRLSWTAMGDNVNLASRLEGMTKQYRCSIIISESTFLQVKGKFVAREVDKIRVKGKKQAITIYQLLGTPAEGQKYESLLADYNAGLERYRMHNWSEAAAIFGPIMVKHPLDGPTQVLLQRCLEFMENPPADDWSGVYSMTSK